MGKFFYKNYGSIFLEKLIQTEEDWNKAESLHKGPPGNS